ncbi:anti-sigma factor [soil metagenome]
MNIQEYISSGIIESYVLGELSAKERSEVDAMGMKHPEVKSEIELVETTLINFAAKTAPAHLKQSILSKIELRDARIVQLETKKSFVSVWLVAASITLFICSAIYILVLMNQLDNLKEYLALTSSEKEKYAKDYEAQSSAYTMMAEQVAILMQPENKKVMLKGMEMAPSALATVYWNQENKDVYINVHQLPMPAADKQYQLWAIVDGKPIDIGMLDLNPDLPPLHKMKTIAGAQAFAVTLEKKGGSTTPTMNAMYLMGNV